MVCLRASNVVDFMLVLMGQEPSGASSDRKRERAVSHSASVELLQDVTLDHEEREERTWAFVCFLLREEI